MRIEHLLAACLLISPSVHAESDKNTPASNHAKSVINAFSVMCTLELPKFDAIAAKASAMRMQVLSENKSPTTDGIDRRQKTWFGGLTTGPFTLQLEEMAGAKGTSTSCTVLAEVPDVEAFRAEATGTMRLAAVEASEVGKDGAGAYVWDGKYGPGTTLIYRHLKPSGKSGIMLRLLSMGGI